MLILYIDFAIAHDTYLHFRLIIIHYMHFISYKQNIPALMEPACFPVIILPADFPKLPPLPWEELPHGRKSPGC